MSVSLLVCYFLTEIKQIWGHLHLWMTHLSEIFLRHSWDIGSLVFTLLGWAYKSTFEFLCSGLNFETSDHVTFWFSGGQLLRPLVLFKGEVHWFWKHISKCYIFKDIKNIGIKNLKTFPIKSYDHIFGIKVNPSLLFGGAIFLVSYFFPSEILQLLYELGVISSFFGGQVKFVSWFIITRDEVYLTPKKWRNNPQFIKKLQN